MHLVSERLEKASSPGLYQHQARALQYVLDESLRTGDIRVDGVGVVFTHQMGTGKGVLMAAVMHYSKMPTVILATRPLLEAAVQAVGVFEKVAGVKFDWSRVRVASMNSSNTMMQLARAVEAVLNPDMQELRGVNARARVAAAASEEEREHLREAALNVGNTLSLNGVLLVVDEAHLLARAVSNGSKNATAIYRAIQRSPRAKVHLFTGTPGIDDPFELALMYNMVGPKSAPPFPETHRDFSRYFVDRTAMRAINTEKWMNRISGLQSHHFASGDDLPTALPPKLHFIEMGAKQYEKYASARESELKEQLKGNELHTPALQRPQSKGASTYRVKSRTAGNAIVAGDEYISEKARKTAEIAESAKRVVVVYTQFIELGEKPIISELRKRGWVSYTESSKSKYRYASINGSVDGDAQTRILKIVNDHENAEGKLLKLVVVSVVATVGLSFIWGADEIIFEPYWNDSLHDQVEARIRRVTSQPGVAKKDRHTQVHFFFAVPPKQHRVELAVARTMFRRPCYLEGKALDEYLQYSDSFGLPTDIALYLTAKTSAKLMRQYRELGERASIEAHLEKRPNARMCKPTGVPLFVSDINQDILEPDPCQPFEKTKISAKKIKIDSEEYFYTESTDSPLGVELFQKNPTGVGYVSVLESDPVYQRFFELR